MRNKYVVWVVIIMVLVTSVIAGMLVGVTSPVQPGGLIAQEIACITGFDVITFAPTTVTFHGPTWWGSGAKTYLVNTRQVRTSNGELLNVAAARYIPAGPYEIDDGLGHSVTTNVAACEVKRVDMRGAQPTATPAPQPTATPVSTNTPVPTVAPTSVPTATPAATPVFPTRKIGIGATGRLTRAEWKLLGRPLVYVWGISASLADTYGYDYTPEMWGCSDAWLQRAKTWPRYGDYMLLFNEPEYWQQANCPPDVAARVTYELHQARPDLKLIVGGVNNAWYWMRQYDDAYMRMYGTHVPASGIHVHVYPRGNMTWQEYATEARAQINGWVAFQNMYPWFSGQLWITEMGILDQDKDFLFANAYMRSMLRWIYQHPNVDRVYWFAYEGETGKANASWRPTMLVWNGERTPLWAAFRDCTDMYTDTLCVGVER